MITRNISWIICDILAAYWWDQRCRKLRAITNGNFHHPISLFFLILNGRSPTFCLKVLSGFSHNGASVVIGMRKKRIKSFIAPLCRRCFKASSRPSLAAMCTAVSPSSFWPRRLAPCVSYQKEKLSHK